MAMRTKKNSLEKRLRELERESSTLRSEIKSLSRNLKDRRSDVPYSGSHDDLGSTSASAPSALMEQAEPARRTAPAPDDLFTPKPEQAPAPKQASRLQPLSTNKPKQVVHNAKLGTYLSAGSLAGPRPLRQEARVIRNKAIFMLAVVLIMAFIVLKIIL